MKVLTFPNKGYSWLQWPVTVKGCKKETLHVTTKFFGQVELNKLAVEIRTNDAYKSWRPEHFAWEPVKFAELIYVLELTKYPAALGITHQQFDIIKDAFEPYRPHISVPLDYWNKVLSGDLTPVMEELTFGELELCIGQAEL